MSTNQKKTEDPNKTIETIRKKGGNKQCFDCDEMGTTFLVVNLGVFVCTSCSGLHREIHHKVKAFGVSNFTE